MKYRPAVRKRLKEPTEAFGASFEAAVRHVAVEFLKSARFKHSATKGTEREIPIRALFSDHLPTRFSVAHGEVVDLRDKHSPQLDLMIYDSSRNFAFYDGDSVILPAEALLASVEVKSTLTRDELRKSLIAANALKALHPFKQPTVAPRKDGAPADSRARYFHCIFAYQTDLAADDWLQQEFSRYREEAAKLKLPLWLIDRIYVPNRGIINPAFDAGLAEEADSGDALLHFYMHTLNFLLRENARREPVPYLAYAGRLTKGWTKLT